MSSEGNVSLMRTALLHQNRKTLPQDRRFPVISGRFRHTAAKWE